MEPLMIEIVIAYEPNHYYTHVGFMVIQLKVCV
jgi:hypothetical protein